MTSHQAQPPPEESQHDDAHPHQPVSGEADPEKETTPAGVVGDLEEMADETGATTPSTGTDEDTDPSR